MPRGGSKKGEHRGNAKPRDTNGMETPNDIMRAAVKMVRKPSRPGKVGPQETKRPTIEDDIRTAQVIHGRRDARDLTPKEIMLDNMAFFQNAAYLTAAMAQAAELNDAPGEKRQRKLAQLNYEEERLRRMASDEARNVAPYMHPRYTAVQISGAGSAGKNIVGLMMEIINRRNQEAPMVIEHHPQKRTA